MPPQPQPSGFGFSDTAEGVTAGIDLTGTTWLVTGANSGLGKETVRVLALRGAHVVAAARTLTKAAGALEDLGISADNGTPVACELSDLASVRACVDAVSSLDQPLDGIIANAGIMALPELQQQSGIELQFFTNHIGHFTLVTGLLDRLTATGRVVMLSSGAHRMAKNGLELDNLSGETDYDPWRMYGQSKLANILFARSLTQRFAASKSNRTANSLHPGVIDTNLARNIPNAAAMYERIAQRNPLKTVAQGASTQCYVATAPKLAGVSAYYFSDNNAAKPIAHAKDDDLAQRLWERSEEIVAAN